MLAENRIKSYDSASFGVEIMIKVLLSVWQLARAFALIYACLYTGTGLSYVLPIAIPGSVLGMCILFLLLVWQILPVSWLQPGCYLLIRYMALLFVPVSVGVMQYFDVLRAQFGPLVVSCVLSTLVVLIAVSFSAQWMQRRQEHGQK